MTTINLKCAAVVLVLIASSSGVGLENTNFRDDVNTEKENNSRYQEDYIAMVVQDDRTTMGSNIAPTITDADAFENSIRIMCEQCYTVVYDLMEASGRSYLMRSEFQEFANDERYAFRVAILNMCGVCYQAMHFYEMNIINTVASNEQLRQFGGTDSYGQIINYLKQLKH